VKGWRTVRASVDHHLGHLFLTVYEPNEVGIHTSVGVRELPAGTGGVGAAVQEAFASPGSFRGRADVHNVMLARTGARSERAFFADARSVLVELSGGQFVLTAERRDGNGFVGDPRARDRRLDADADATAVGEEILEALVESADLTAR
jgi:hypothetical protein